MDLELLYQLTSSNPLAFNNLVSLSCRTGDKQAVQLASRLLFFSIGPGPRVSCSSFPLPHWLEYRSHCSAVASSIKIHVKLLPEVAAAAKAGDKAAGGALVDFWLGSLQELLMGSKLQLLSLQGLGSVVFSYSRPSNHTGMQQQLCHVAPAAHAHLQLLLWSVRGVAATAEQLVGLEPRVGGSSWWRRCCCLVGALAGYAGASILHLGIWVKAADTAWPRTLGVVRLGITLVTAIAVLVALGGGWYWLLHEEVVPGLIVVALAALMDSICDIRESPRTRQLLFRVACLRPVACRRYLGPMLELAILQYQNIQFWQVAVLGVVQPPAAAGGVSADVSDVLAILDNLPKRLDSLPDRGLPPAVMKQLQHVAKKWPCLHESERMTEQPQQQNKQLIGNHQRQQPMQQMVGSREQQMQLFRDLLVLFRVLLAEVPFSMGCNNPACARLDGLSELKASPKVCSGCKVACYCCEACQHGHWKQHRAACERLRSQRLMEKQSKGKKNRL